jgi:amino acid adenylation domain-containing protein
LQTYYEIVDIIRSRRDDSAAESVAVADACERLTYAGLDEKSTRLAMRLREAGVGPGRCAGVLVERSARFVVAALGIVKAGAAYVPLDPSTPVDRAAFILENAGATALVTQPNRMDRLPQGSWLTVDVDDLPALDTSRFTVAQPDPESVAYIIYTSGSSGQPKGVEVTHANLANLIDWHRRAFDVTSADCASLVAGLGFDAAVWEIWPYLAAGAAIVVAGEEVRRSADQLQQWLVEQRITIGFVPTILAEPMIAMSWPENTRLRYLLTGGDVLRRRPNRELPFALVNNYGPTECTVVATSGVVSPEDTNERPSIGRPITNATALILDEELNAVPSGHAGELCLAGALVTRGYRHLPDATAKAFVEYTGAGGSLQRIYRTGDRARLLENGEIEFLGRLDDQVQIRGHRVEPGEIVARLNECTGVACSAVVARTASPADPALVAYVVAADGARLTATGLRTALTAKLPEYMIPSSFVSLPSLPQTANGKLDRSGLPLPCEANRLPNDSGDSATAAPPDEGVQRDIATMVGSLLEQSSIDPQANFFLIGGHSMLAVQLVARIHDAFGVKLTLRQVFTAPTVAALSTEVTRLKTGTYA